MTEISLFRDQGLKLVGPVAGIAAELHDATSRCRGRAAAGDRAVPTPSRALIRHLQGADARSLFVNAGIEPAP